MRYRVLAPLLAATCLCATTQAADPAPITTRSLLGELTDLRHLAEFPAPPFTCAQFSSYDRRSREPNQPEQAEDGWFANNDFNQYVRVEEHGGRKEYVMAEMEGPGAIVRIWSANPKGTLLIYLDGVAEPALAVPMQDFLGGWAPGVPAPIACERGSGWTSYFPIPYARHCKVTCDTNEFYYHVNYRTYPAGTPVQTFARQQLDELRDVIWDSAGKLAAPYLAGRGRDEQAKREPWKVELAPAPSESPGAGASSYALAGPGAIAGLEVKIKAQDLVQALRHTLLYMRFDDEETVAVPLGDFFGSVPGLNEYDSLPLGVLPGGRLYAHWFMPYEKSAALVAVNLGREPVQLEFIFDTVPYAWTDRSLHFHAKWHGDINVPTRPFIDWNYLSTHGQGVFVGAAFAIANPSRLWWGEGDEKIFVDGEAFPSTFGTGTEDYFSYAWGSDERFKHAFHNQPRCDTPGSYGHVAVNRWHVLDAIPFTRDFKFDMELWHWDPEVKVDMSAVAYWYARPGATDTAKPLTRANLTLKLLPEYEVTKVPGAIEGERLRVLEKPEKARVSPELVPGASKDEILRFHRATALGDRVVLGFDVQAAGMYRVLARHRTAPDCGIVQWSVNGQKAGDPVDLYSPKAALAPEVPLGSFELTAGENRLSAELVGTNEKSINLRYLFGLDYIRLEPATK
jgi:hypothetical protein